MHHGVGAYCSHQGSSINQHTLASDGHSDRWAPRLLNHWRSISTSLSHMVVKAAILLQHPAGATWVIRIITSMCTPQVSYGH